MQSRAHGWLAAASSSKAAAGASESQQELPGLLGTDKAGLSAKVAGGEQQRKQVFVVVADELAPSQYKGLRGTLKEYKGDEAYVVPFSSSSKAVPTLMIKKAFVHEVSDLEAKTASHSTRKQCSWIDSNLALKIYDDLMFKPREEVPDISYELWEDQVDAGIAEILYRLLPGPGFVVASSNLANFLSGFQDAGEIDDLALDNPMVQTLTGKVKRGKVCCIPINSGRHFTLLVLKRKGAAGENEQTVSTNPLGSFDKQRRQNAEREQFDMGSWPAVETSEAVQWEVTYYDSHPTEIGACRRVAQSTLQLLFLQGPGTFDELPARQNQLLQPPGTVQCGFFALHYVEEEARCWLGERKGSQPLNLEYRRERINAMGLALVTRKAQKEVRDEDKKSGK